MFGAVAALPSAELVKSPAWWLSPTRLLGATERGLGLMLDPSLSYRLGLSAAPCVSLELNPTLAPNTA